jgi:hypothetical protein
MKVVLGIVFLLLLLGNGAFAESDADKKNQSQTAQQKAENKQSSFSKPVRAAISAKSGEKNFYNFSTLHCNCKPSKEERKWYDVMDKNRFLLFIAFLQLGVFVWQALRLSDTVKVTKDSVDALKKSERPYIFVSTEVVFSDVANMKQTATCSFIVRNLGKTPSIITFADFKIMRTGETDFSLGENGQINAREVYAAGEGFKPSRCRNLPAETQNGKLFSYGKIIYKDIFGEEHLTEFHHVFVAPIEGFCVSSNTERNRNT